jgi:hypothetical protein
MNRLLGVVAVAFVFTWGMADGADEKSPSAFGSREKSEAALIGILYDLKQTQRGEATPINVNNYSSVVDEFLGQNWDESVLNRYYRVSRPLYTTQVFVPIMNADQAPKAFEVQDTVKPRMWIIHYKGQVSPPRSGTYRFVGYSDDFIAVAINGKTVLLSARGGIQLPSVNWRSTEKDGAQASNGKLRVGDWIHLSENVPVDIDVVMGERPGGQFSAFLLYEEKGATYSMDGGYPVLPVFQLAPKEIPPLPPNLAPRTAAASASWKGWQ